MSTHHTGFLTIENKELKEKITQCVIEWQEKINKTMSSKFNLNTFEYIKFRDSVDFNKKLNFAKKGIEKNISKSTSLFCDIERIKRENGDDVLSFEINIFLSYIKYISELKNTFIKKEKDKDLKIENNEVDIDEIKKEVKKSVEYIKNHATRYLPKKIKRREEEEGYEYGREQLERAREQQAMIEDAERWGYRTPFAPYERYSQSQIDELEKYYGH